MPLLDLIDDVGCFSFTEARGSLRVEVREARDDLLTGGGEEEELVMRFETGDDVGVEVERRFGVPSWQLLTITGRLCEQGAIGIGKVASKLEASSEGGDGGDGSEDGDAVDEWSDVVGSCEIKRHPANLISALKICSDIVEHHDPTFRSVGGELELISNLIYTLETEEGLTWHVQREQPVRARKLHLCFGNDSPSVD